MNCICGHRESDHVDGGRCRVPDCPCEHFQPGISSGMPRLRCSIVALLVLAIGVLGAWGARGEGTPEKAAPRGEGAEVALPVSFAEVAAAARAAAIVILAPENGTTVPDDLDVDVARGERTLGAGIIVDPRGIALTSARAVLLDAEFEVVAGDGTPIEAAILGFDRRTDVAVLKLKDGGKTFPHVALGDSRQLRVGDWVLAVGAPHGLAATVAAGVVSATPAPGSPNPLGKFLQTDAITGLSLGAPLISMQGKVVGLGTGHGIDGVAYATPSSTVGKVYLELLEYGRVRRAWLGVTTQSLTADVARLLRAPGATGVLVTDALPDGPATGTLRSGDVLLRLDGTRVMSRAQLERAVDALAPGRAVRVAFRRDGREMSKSITLSEEPDELDLPPLLARVDRLLGIEVRPITPTMGVVVASIDPAGPAAAAGIADGDILREVDRRPLRSIADFEPFARRLKPGAAVLMLVQRGEVAVYVALTARE
jgi:serine protease Do